MSHLFDLMDVRMAESLLKQHASACSSPIVLFDADKNAVMSSPSADVRGELAMTPLLVRGSTVGYAAMPADGASEHLGCIGRTLSALLEMGYEIESLSAEVARNYEELSIMWKLSSRLGAGLDVDRICRVLAEEVMGICPSHTVTVFLIGEMPTDGWMPPVFGGERGPGKDVCFPKVSLGTYANMASMMILRTDRGLVGHVFEQRQPLAVCDVSRDGRFEGFSFPVRSVLIIPLIVEDATIGVVVASDKQNGDEFFSTEIKLVQSIASECAIAIKKASLFDETRGMLFSAAEAFASAIDAKDAYTYGHSKRVADLSVRIARAVGFTPDAISWVRLAGLMHDIGKIGTPETILNKGGVLDTAEMDAMKEHAVVGARILEHIPKFKEISRWIRHHHEKYDGSGYPDGLKGDMIPLPSRILAIPDYYDALTTDRPYRRGIGRDEALSVMKETVGAQIDAALFECFQKVLP